MSYDADTVNALEITSLSRFTANEIIKTFAATFFHTFETTNEVHREGDSFLVMVLQYIEPSKYRPFIVRASATDETTRCFVNCKRERVSVPPI